MNWADITIICIILLSAVLSLFRGFVREVLSLVAWIVAFWAAMAFWGQVAVMLAPYIAIEFPRMVLSFLAILVGVLLVFGIINFIVGRLMASTGLSGPDRLLGALFGMLRGAAIVTVLVVLAGLTPLPGDPSWAQSRMLVGFQSAAMLAIGQLPPEFGKHFSYSQRGT
jgi:membrane protein required for colicin V production